MVVAAPSRAVLSYEGLMIFCLPASLVASGSVWEGPQHPSATTQYSHIHTHSIHIYIYILQYCIKIHMQTQGHIIYTYLYISRDKNLRRDVLQCLQRATTVNVF